MMTNDIIQLSQALYRLE